MSDESIDFEELEGEVEVTPPEVYASNLIEWAVDRHASDLFVSDSDKSVLISVRRLGQVEPVRQLARGFGHRLQGHLRVLAGADAGELIRPAEGRAVLSTPGGQTVDIRLSAMPTLYGQDVAIRLFHPIRGVRSIDNLGFDPTEMSLVNDLLSRPSGLILVAGPVASGKSSTLYAALDALNDGSRKIHTLEDPIEHSIPGIMQSQVNAKAGLDFADLLSVVLRHSPDVIMVGEIRDQRTAETAVRAGSSGQLVLATIHAKNAADAIDSMRQYETHSKFLANSLVGVINQRLIRRLCEQCREPHEVSLDVPPRIADRLDGDAPKLYSATGCSTCYKDGFDSLTCAPEILVTNQEVTEVISRGASAAEVEDVARTHGMLTLSESVAARVYRGETTPEEANRAVPDSHLASLVGLVRNG